MAAGAGGGRAKGGGRVKPKVYIPTAEDVFKHLEQHHDFIHSDEGDYKHLPRFTLEDVETFMRGERGRDGTLDYGAKLGISYQIKQALGCIGAHLVDKGKADPQTAAVSHGIWQIKMPNDVCAVCGCVVKESHLMMRQKVCRKARCQLTQWQNSI